METYQFLAIALMLALGFVAHLTLKLNGFRKRNGIAGAAINLRDLAVVRQPSNFDAEEVYLVRATWIASASSFALVLLLLAVSPPDLYQRLGLL